MDNGTLCNFANDTSNAVEADSIELLKKQLEEDSEKIIKFMATNELVINTDKTQFTIFNRKDCEEKINIGKDEVTAGKSGELLGMTLSSDLSWKDHVKALKTSLRIRLGVLKRVKNKVPKQTLNQITENCSPIKSRNGRLCRIPHVKSTATL